MNWLMIAVVGGAAAWFEYSYRRSKRSPKKAPAEGPSSTAHVEQAGQVPSISPGSENDKKLNTSA
jgi:hypothetical protein